MSKNDGKSSNGLTYRSNSDGSKSYGQRDNAYGFRQTERVQHNDGKGHSYETEYHAIGDGPRVNSK